MELAELETKSVEELQGIAKEMEIPDSEDLRKQDLTFKIMQTRTEQNGLIFGPPSKWNAHWREGPRATETPNSLPRASTASIRSGGT